MHKKLAWLFAIVFLVLGLLPNVLSSLVEVSGADRWIYLVTGLLALVTAMKPSMVGTFFKTFGVIYGIMAVWGFASPDSMPVGSIAAYDNVFHLVVAVVALWAGYKKS